MVLSDWKECGGGDDVSVTLSIHARIPAFWGHALYRMRLPCVVIWFGFVWNHVESASVVEAIFVGLEVWFVMLASS